MEGAPLSPYGMDPALVQVAFGVTTLECALEFAQGDAGKEKGLGSRV